MAWRVWTWLNTYRWAGGTFAWGKFVCIIPFWGGKLWGMSWQASIPLRGTENPLRKLLHGGIEGRSARIKPSPVQEVSQTPGPGRPRSAQVGPAERLTLFETFLTTENFGYSWLSASRSTSLLVMTLPSDSEFHNRGIFPLQFPVSAFDLFGSRFK